jgi:uncharacterized damage-inducible protein DinB
MTPGADLTALLESSRRDLLAALENISDDQARARPAPERWSVLECVEHVVVVEQRFQGWIEEAQRLEQPQKDLAKAAELLARVQDRSVRAEAPAPVRPVGRFETVAQARALFNRVRDRSVRLAQERGEELYSLLTDQHRRFGPMNGVELMHLIAGHSSRHAAQIRETVK